MKRKILLATFVVTLMAGCGPATEQSETTAPEGTDNAAANAVEQSGSPSGDVSAIQVTPQQAVLSQLEDDLSKLGCFACHAIDEKRIGPSYRSIAVLYREADATALLVNKVINGGGGIWGPMPMITHPHLTPEILTPLIKRILALPNEE